MGELKLNQPGFYDAEGKPMGAFFDMHESEYFAVKAMSFTGSKAFRRSPLHFQAFLKQDKWDLEPKRQQYKAVHKLTLESADDDKFHVQDGTWSPKIKKELEEIERASGKLAIKSDHLAEARAIRDAFRRHDLADAILSKSMGEVSMFWIDEESGAYCKGRIDVLSITDYGICIGDIKNFADLMNNRLLWKHIADSFYHHQQAFYARGVLKCFGSKPIKKYWFFVEGDEPYGIRLVNCTDPMIECADLEISKTLLAYQECVTTNNWPCYPIEETDGDLPNYSWGVV